MLQERGDSKCHRLGGISDFSIFYKCLELLT